MAGHVQVVTVLVQSLGRIIGCIGRGLFVCICVCVCVHDGVCMYVWVREREGDR